MKELMHGLARKELSTIQGFGKSKDTLIDPVYARAPLHFL